MNITSMKFSLIKVTIWSTSIALPPVDSDNPIPTRTEMMRIGANLVNENSSGFGPMVFE